MKLQTIKEVADKKQAELTKDISRTKETKATLEEYQNKLSEAEAKFNVALSNQHVRWVTEEEEHIKKIEELRREIKTLEEQGHSSLVPIVEREQKSYALFTQAEQAYKDADSKRNELDEATKKQEELVEILEDKIDSLTEREQEVFLREQRVIVREKALEDERSMQKKASEEFLIKLQNLK